MRAVRSITLLTFFTFTLVNSKLKHNSKLTMNLHFVGFLVICEDKKLQKITISVDIIELFQDFNPFYITRIVEPKDKLKFKN